MPKNTNTSGSQLPLQAFHTFLISFGPGPLRGQGRHKPFRILRLLIDGKMEKCQKGVIQQDLEVFPSNKGLLLTHTLTVLCMTSLGDNVKSLNVTALE